MSPLDAARRLADLYPITEAGGMRFHDHGFCGGGGECPHFALPAIVAALEAADRVLWSVDEPMWLRGALPAPIMTALEDLEIAMGELSPLKGEPASVS